MAVETKGAKSMNALAMKPEYSGDMNSEIAFENSSGPLAKAVKIYRPKTAHPMSETYRAILDSSLYPKAFFTVLFLQRGLIPPLAVPLQRFKVIPEPLYLRLKLYHPQLSADGHVVELLKLPDPQLKLVLGLFFLGDVVYRLYHPCHPAVPVPDGIC